MERVQEGGDELGLVVAGRLDPPCERQARPRAGGKLELVAIEAAALAGIEFGPEPPDIANPS